MVVVSTLKTANYGVKEKLHREKSAGGELIEFCVETVSRGG
jgi:hypothetical protein|tara:strand:- start:24 stop:146 length:123 start_codon:yes stop_codon:yes gene_type:complete